jgi:hypothetical protein
MACRIGAFGVLGWLLGGSIIPSTARTVESVSAAAAGERLGAITRAPGNLAVHVTVEATPEPWVTDWFAALRHSGRAVSWTGSPPPLAISGEPIADPRGGTRVSVAAPSGSSVILSDDASVIDSVRVANLGASVDIPVVVGAVNARVGRETAVTRESDATADRAILVVGAAGWEGKYVVAALEERGWLVNARFAVAPGVEVSQGALQPIDTARFAVVVAIDSTVSSLAPLLERYVRSGGGLVLAGTAAAALPRLAPGLPAGRTRPALRVVDTIRLGSTGFYPVSALKDDGVVLERRGEGVAVAARRVAAGRVVQVGYDDTWRWRMAGAPGAEDAHREWWSRVVGSAAFVRSENIGATSAGAAPIATLYDRLGAPRATPPDASSPPIDRRLWITVMMILLLSEWSSRRLRGLR